MNSVVLFEVTGRRGSVWEGVLGYHLTRNIAEEAVAEYEKNREGWSLRIVEKQGVEMNGKYYLLEEVKITPISTTAQQN